MSHMFHLEEHNLAVKPMSCPFHINMFGSLVQSYKQLPFRISEFGLCHRHEPSGSLNGLFRLRAFNQDDGHIFCREEQIKSELKHFCKMLFEMYQFFGFKRQQIAVNISLRPNNRLGSNALWDRSEAILLEHYNGRLPAHINPYSIVLLPVGQQHTDYCISLKSTLKAADISCIIDDSNNSIGYRVREAFKKKCNYSIVIGNEELASGQLNLKYKKSMHTLHSSELVDFLLKK